MTKKTHNPYYAAQDILSRRDHSEREVRRKLERKGFSREQIDEVVEKLERLSLLDDEKFARLFVEQKLRAKPVGPRWLQFKLREKGVASDIVERVLEDVFFEEREKELAVEAVERWRRVHAGRGKEKERLARHLQSRGFSGEVVRKVTG